jgi:hypothetical protein
MQISTFWPIYKSIQKHIIIKRLLLRSLIMPMYCVNKGENSEVHMMSCVSLPKSWNRIEFEAMNDFDAMEKARDFYSDADGCAHCMSAYHSS